MMINILIADDHPIVRRGLKQIVQDEKDMKVICEASNSDEVMQGLKDYKIDIPTVVFVKIAESAKVTVSAALEILNGK